MPPIWRGELPALQAGARRSGRRLHLRIGPSSRRGHRPTRIRLLRLSVVRDTPEAAGPMPPWQWPVAAYPQETMPGVPPWQVIRGVQTV